MGPFVCPLEPLFPGNGGTHGPAAEALPGPFGARGVSVFCFVCVRFSAGLFGDGWVEAILAARWARRRGLGCWGGELWLISGIEGGVVDELFDRPGLVGD